MNELEHESWSSTAMTRLFERVMDVGRFRRSDENEDGGEMESERLVRKEGEGDQLDSDMVDVRFRELQRRYRNLKRWMIGVVTLLLLGVVLLAVAAGLLGKRYMECREERGMDTDLGRRPWLPLTQVTFERDDLFAAASSPQSDEAWGSLMPPGDGFIHLPSTATTNSTTKLPAGIGHNASSFTYDTTLFHQLHCLTHIRTYLWTLNATVSKPPFQSDKVYTTLLRPQQDHVNHCFDYIRQSLMCYGDLTYEWPRTESDGRRFAVDGWGVQHECRKWEAVVEFMRENSVASRKGKGRVDT